MALEVDILEESFDLVAPQGEELMRTFYDELFAAAPGVKPLFADVDMERQRQALLNMLVVLRESLRDLDDIVPDLEDARRAARRSTARSPSTTRSSAGADRGDAEDAGDAWKPEYTRRGRRHTGSSRA